MFTLVLLVSDCSDSEVYGPHYFDASDIVRPPQSAIIIKELPDSKN